MARQIIEKHLHSVQSSLVARATGRANLPADCHWSGIAATEQHHHPASVFWSEWCSSLFRSVLPVDELDILAVVAGKTRVSLLNRREISIELTSRCFWSCSLAFCCSRCLRSSSCRRRSFSRSAANDRRYSSSCSRLSSSRLSRLSSSSVSRCRWSLKESWHWIRLSRTSLGVLLPSMISSNSSVPRDRVKIRSKGNASLSVVAKRWAHWLPTHRRMVSINLTNVNRIQCTSCLTESFHLPVSIDIRSHIPSPKNVVIR